jgi:hypothetical protein
MQQRVTRTFLRITQTGTNDPVIAAVTLTIEPGHKVSTTSTGSGAANGGVLLMGKPTQAKTATVTDRLLPIEVRDGDRVLSSLPLTGDGMDTPAEESNIAFITPHSGFADTPEMPKLRISLPGASQSLEARWQLTVEYKRPGGRQLDQDKVGFPSKSPGDYGFARPASEPWQLENDQWWYRELQIGGFFGGLAKVYLKLGDKEVGEVFRLRIGGKNPDNNLARQSLASRQPDLWYAYAICKHETAEYRYGGTYYNQFVGNPKGKKLVYSSYGRTFKFSYGEPTWNWDFSDNKPGGYGLFQVTGWQGQTNGDVPRDVIWNWQRNMDEGAIEIRRDKVPNATAYFNAVKGKYGANTPDPPTVSTGGSRDLTGFEASVIVRYNGTGQLPTHPELSPPLQYTQDPWTYSNGSWRGPASNKQDYLNKLLPEFE